MPKKPIHWVGAARDELRAFPDPARQRVGYELYRVQQGLDPTDAKPLTSVGRGVYEIRVRADGAYRVCYVAKLAEAIYVLHAFEKKSQRTPKAALALGKQRLQAVLQHRKQR